MRGGSDAIAIVGGGVAGLSLARELARRGLRCVLLEGAGLGAGASGVPAALLNPFRGRTARASAADLDGLEAVWDLARDLRRRGHDPGTHATGVLRVAATARQAHLWRRREGATWLEPEEVPPPYRAPHGALFVERGGWLEPRLWLAALAADAREAGAELRLHTRVLALAPARDGVRLATDAGAVAARHVVLCVGADTAPGLPLPELERVAGDVATVPCSPAPPYPLAGAVYAAFDGERARIGGHHRPAGHDDPNAAHHLVSSLRRILPDATAAPSELWTGVRARAASPTPLVREMAPGVTFFGALAGRGFLASTALARRLALRLAEGSAHGGREAEGFPDAEDDEPG